MGIAKVGLSDTQLRSLQYRGMANTPAQDGDNHPLYEMDGEIYWVSGRFLADGKEWRYDLHLYSGPLPGEP